MLKVLIAVQALSAVAMVVLILLQHGKGADMGAAFGSGASGSLFGASGGANFLSHATAVLAATFFLSTLGQVFFVSSGNSSVENEVLQKAFSQQTAPATPVDPAAKGLTVDTSTTPASPQGLPSGK